METSQSTRIALKAIGIYWLITLVAAIPSGISAWYALERWAQTDSFVFGLIISVLFFSLSAAGIFVLWKVANSAKVDLETLADARPLLSLSLKDFEQGCLYALGLLCFVWSLPYIPGDLAQLKMLILSVRESSGNFDATGQLMSLLNTPILVVLGWFLVFRTSGTHSWIMRKRK